MNRPPRAPKEPIITRSLGTLIAFEATLLSTATLTAFWWGLHLNETNEGAITHAQTMAFTTLALSQCAHAFTARSQTHYRKQRNWWLIGAVTLSLLLQLTPVLYPALNHLLGTTPLTFIEWRIVLICSVAPFIVERLLLRATHTLFPGCTATTP